MKALIACVLFASACATNPADPDDPAADFGDGKSDGLTPPNKAWLPLEKGETLSVPFTSDAGTPVDMVYAELAVSAQALVSFAAADTTLYLYRPDDATWGPALHKRRDQLTAELDAGRYRLLMLRRKGQSSVTLQTGCAGDGCTFYPGFPIDPPQVINVSGGPVQTSPRLVSVTFDGNPLRDDLEGFLAAVPGSDYWARTTGEYGIGDATAGTPVHLTEAAPAAMTKTEVQRWVAAHLDGTHPEWGTPDAHSFYVVYFPATTVLDLDGGKSCVAFGGYHDSTKLADGSRVVFAAMPRCDSFNGMRGLDAATGATSHELIEGASDPYSDEPAYGLPDPLHIAWNLDGGGELGDMCAFVPGAFTHVRGLPYLVQRTWSNLAARMGADPCVPHVDAEPYVVAAPILDRIGDSSDMTFGESIAVGKSRTIEVDLSATGPIKGPITVTAVDGTFITGAPANLTFAWDRTTGVNGDRLHLTITATKADPRGFDTFLILAKDGDTNAALWHGIVTF